MLEMQQRRAANDAYRQLLCTGSAVDPAKTAMDNYYESARGEGKPWVQQQVFQQQALQQQVLQLKHEAEAIQRAQQAPSDPRKWIFEQTYLAPSVKKARAASSAALSEKNLRIQDRAARDARARIKALAADVDVRRDRYWLGRALAPIEVQGILTAFGALR